MRHRPAFAVLATFLVATTIAAEEPRRAMGLLTCTLKERTKDNPENMTCGFAASAGAAPVEKYSADVGGLALPALGKQVLVWTVRSRGTIKPGAGFLAQSYSREKAPGQPPAWVGQQNSAIALQFESHASAELGSGIDTIVIKVATTSA